MSTPAGDDDDEENWVDDEPMAAPHPVRSFLTNRLNTMFQGASKNTIAFVHDLFRGPPPPPPPPYMTPPTDSTPVHTLPAELLADIFQLGQDAHAELHEEIHADVDEDDDNVHAFEIDDTKIDVSYFCCVCASGALCLYSSPPVGRQEAV